MSRLKPRLERLEGKMSNEEEPLILKTHSGNVLFEGGVRELKVVLDEVATNGKSLIQETE